MIDKRKIENEEDVARAFEVAFTNANAPIFRQLRYFFLFGGENLRNDIDYHMVLAAVWKIYEASMIFNWSLSEETLTKMESFGGRDNLVEPSDFDLEESLLDYHDVQEAQDAILCACQTYFEIDHGWPRSLLKHLTKVLVEAQSVQAWSDTTHWLFEYAAILNVIEAVITYKRAGNTMFRFGV